MSTSVFCDDLNEYDDEGALMSALPIGNGSGMKRTKDDRKSRRKLRNLKFCGALLNLQI